MSKIVEQLNNSLPSISTPMMKGDNLAIVLCTVFDDGREETADDNGWSIAARNGYEEVIAAIRDHYKPAADTITALRAEVEDLGNRLHHVHRLWANNEHALRAENERLRAALRGVIRVADRKTVEFDEARAALEEK